MSGLEKSTKSTNTFSGQKQIHVVPFSGSYSCHPALSSLYNTLDILLPSFPLHANAQHDEDDVWFTWCAWWGWDVTYPWPWVPSTDLLCCRRCEGTSPCWVMCTCVYPSPAGTCSSPPLLRSLSSSHRWRDQSCRCPCCRWRWATLVYCVTKAQCSARPVTVVACAGSGSGGRL